MIVGGIVASPGGIDTGGQDGDAALAGEDVAVELAPGVEPGDVGCVGTLQRDQEGVGEAVSIEAALNVDSVESDVKRPRDLVVV